MKPRRILVIAATTVGLVAASAPVGHAVDQAVARTVSCKYRRDNGPTAGRHPKLPVSSARTDRTYYATVNTDRGRILFKLDAKHAPCTVNSFVSLSRQGFYADTKCHRLLDLTEQSLAYAVLQCGDPTGTGEGGPGYAFADENLRGAKYTKGVVAMANAGPNTNGSQFFINFKNSAFAPQYTPFATVVSGLSVVDGVAKGGTETSPETGANDSPRIKLKIASVRISSEKP